MSIPDKNIVVSTVCKRYNCSLSNIIRKKIMYHGVSNGKSLVLCTPESRLHPQGHGWFDLTTKQVDLLDDADIAILAVRLEGYKIYYVNFKQLRQLITPDMSLNYSEDEKWRFYIWEKYIKVRGNDMKFDIEPEFFTF
ncbi:hypothetical protein [Metabacillus sp. B2-18]|uniref:hypothetical protein n=1 Tax=Metabacillus sp. B2-18 TaxID=2897333 RepID=UPI001E2B15BE|nr:hypothetical protein [Metabacillus sp. B2-18]UGB29960.1 hypothetical protein LPC09_19910 [Metabacillus sp. B2-18]